jgi:hypothetical protein
VPSVHVLHVGRVVVVVEVVVVVVVVVLVVVVVVGTGPSSQTKGQSTQVLEQTQS